MTIDKELLEELKEAYDSNSEKGPINNDTLGNVFKDAGEPLPSYKLRDVCSQIQKCNGESISFNEFVKIFEQLNLGKSKGNKLKQNVQTKAGITQLSGYEQTSAGTVHSVSNEERASFSNYINLALADDPDCKIYLPINPNSDELFEKMKDGIILCKIVNKAVPNTIDERAINKKKISAFTANENLDLGINSSISIGCHVVNISPEDIREGRVHLVLGILWQIIKLAVFRIIDLKETPNLVCLLREGETLEDLLALSPEDLLMRWVNYQIEKTGCQRTLNNFSSDLKDSEIYGALEKAIMSDKLIHSESKINSENDLEKRAEMVLANAKNAGIASLVSPTNIVNGNSKLNMVFIADMFNKYPNLMTVETPEIISETREEKTYRNWMNSLGVKPFVTHLYTDLSSGIVLLQLLDILSPGCVVWEKINQPPFKINQAHLKKTENCNKVIELAKKLNVSAVGISGKDIADGYKLYVLGVVWQLASMYTLQILQKLSGSMKPITDAEIIEWANQKLVSSQSRLKISSFKDSCVINSFAIFDVIDAIRQNSVDRSMIKSNGSSEENLLNAKLAISLARKIGAKVYALPEDVVEAKVKMIMTIFACLMTVDYSKS